MGKSKSTKEVLASLGTKKKGKKQKGGGAKKIGNHLVHCARYRSEGRCEKNKARKARKLLKFMAKKAKSTGA